MTTPELHQVLNRCPHCDLEYVGGVRAPCPLCPLTQRFRETESELHASKLYLVIEHTNMDAFEDALNGLVVGSWTVEAIRTGHRESDGNGGPLYIAVFRRSDYDPERHVKAAAAHDDAQLDYQEKRREIGAETKAFIVARSGGV